MKRCCMIAVVLLAACAVKPAAAASCTAFASSLVFGNYAGSTVDVTGSITVTCTSGTAYHIGLNAGNTGSATITNRKMFGGNGGQNTLGYQLFSDAARTINWGDSAGTNWVSGTGDGTAQPYAIYARIPENQALGYGFRTVQGNYTDTITASITGSFTTATAQFSVTATVIPGCSVAATPLNFGAYTGSLDDAQSLISVTCTPHLVFQVGLDAGTAAGATVTNRSMTGPGGALVHYGLFQDRQRTLNWGNTVGVDTQSGSGNANGRADVFVVWGRMPGGQSANPGAYSDTITVTVTF